MNDIRKNVLNKFEYLEKLRKSKEVLYNVEFNKFQIDILEDSIDFVIKHNKELSKKQIMLLLSIQSEIAHKQENKEIEIGV